MLPLKNQETHNHLSIHLFIIDADGIVTISPQYFRIFVPIPSIPQALRASNLSISFLTSKGVICVMSNLAYRGSLSFRCLSMK